MWEERVTASTNESPCGRDVQRMSLIRPYPRGLCVETTRYHLFKLSDPCGSQLKRSLEVQSHRSTILRGLNNSLHCDFNPASSLVS